ncbi:MAG: hypothetical protein ACI87O_002481 [Planctomycetota bacterium]|jgi:hypothetical protein
MELPRLTRTALQHQGLGKSNSDMDYEESVKAWYAKCTEAEMFASHPFKSVKELAKGPSLV